MDNIIELLKANISIGKENAIHQIDLAEKIGVKSEVAKRYVQYARKKGLFICSGKAGYWFAENDADLKAYENMARRQAITRLKTTKVIRHRLREYKGQMSITDTLKDGKGDA